MTEKYYKVIIEHEYIVKADSYQKSLDAVENSHNIMYSEESFHAYELAESDLKRYGVGP